MSGTDFMFPLSVRIVVSVFLTVVMTIGILGNVIVCVVIATAKELHSSINILIFNLAIADILQSFNMAFMIVAVNYGKWVLGDTMCQVNGFVTISFVITSMINLFIISVNRYIKICRPSHTPNVFTNKILVWSIFISWFIPALLGIGPVLGWSQYLYRPGKLLCTVKFSYSYSYTFAMMAAAVCVPFVGICFCYYKIITTIRESRKRVLRPGSAGGLKSKRIEGRISMMLGVVIVSFAVFYMPASISNYYEMGRGGQYELPVGIDVVCVMLAMLNHANNPIIYGLMNKNFRKHFFVLFKRCGCGSGSGCGSGIRSGSGSGSEDVRDERKMMQENSFDEEEESLHTTATLV